MVMMKNQWRRHAVELAVVVLILTIFSGSNGRNLAVSQADNSRSNGSTIGAEHDSWQQKPMTVKADGDSTHKGHEQGNAKSYVNVKLGNHEKTDPNRSLIRLPNEVPASVLPAISTLSKPTISRHSLLPAVNQKTLAEMAPTFISGDLENDDNRSVEMLNIAEDASEISSVSPTTYRPARPSVTPNTSAQERDRKLMNVLAARRIALHRGGFRTRIGTTGRSSIVALLETTSKTPTDARSICIRNCTKNFTRRTTVSCMRQCSNFSRSAGLDINSISTNSSIMIVRPSSRTGLGTQASDRDNNEILFTDESSHGLFVVAKEQNDTTNHIPDAAKIEKFRPRNRLLSSVTAAPSSIEDADIQPYLYFGQKLPPIKPAALTITSVSEEHPKLLEVAVAQLVSTTQASPLPTPPLSAVERSRSRYKYRDRGYISARHSPIRVSALSSVEPRSALILRTKGNASARDRINSAAETLVSENSPEKNISTQSTTSFDSSTPLIIRVFAEGDENLQLDRPINESVPQIISSQDFTTVSTKTAIADELIILRDNQTQSTDPPLTVLRTTVPKETAVKTYIQMFNTSTARASSIPPTTLTTMKGTVKNTFLETITTDIGTISTTPLTMISPKISTARPKAVIEEDIEKLRELGPGLTQVIENDENFVIFLNQTAPRPNPFLETETTDPSLSILRTTVLTSVRSTVNPRTETQFFAVENNTSTQIGTTYHPSFVGIIETTPIEKPIRDESRNASGADIKSTYVAAESDMSIEMRRVNIATMVLAGIGIIPLCALILYFVRSFLLQRSVKNEEDFDVCITDQQPISPVKRLDAKYHTKTEDGDYDDNTKNTNSSHYHMSHHISMAHGKIPPRDVNQNNRYDEQCSVTSDQEFDRNNIRLKSLLGEGNFGQVWKAEADDLSGHFGATRIVAVKTIRKCSAQTSLKEESKIMRKLGSHQNVVTLLGACVDNEPHMLIMEYAMRGRLLSLLRAARSATNILPASVPGGRSLTPLSPRTLGAFALDIACGMEYIAEKRIVHRDLAARNVLLDHNGVCKICDFGMSLDLDCERKKKETENNASNKMAQCSTKKNKFDFGSRFIVNHWNQFNGQDISLSLTKDGRDKRSNLHSHGHDTISRRPALPIRWMAPEALQYHIFTRETDMWAFGIVLWEIATLGSTPYANLSGREVIRRVPNGLRPELPKEGRHEFYNLMIRCWHKDPHVRPSFTYARQEISRSLHNWVDEDSTASDYMDVSGFSEDLEHGMVYFNHRISEFECEI